MHARKLTYMCAHMHALKHACVHAAHMCARTRASVCAHVCACKHMHAHMCKHVHMQIHVNARVHAHVRTCVRRHTNTHMCAQTHFSIVFGGGQVNRERVSSFTLPWFLDNFLHRCPCQKLQSFITTLLTSGQTTDGDDVPEKHRPSLLQVLRAGSARATASLTVRKLRFLLEL